MITNERLRQAMREISRKKGDFTLFAKVRRADALGSWDLLVSAPWLEHGTLKATSEFVELLADVVGESSLREFARIATVGADHPAVKLLVESLGLADGGERIQRTDLFGVAVEEAIVFRAKKPSTNGARSNGRVASSRGR